MRQNRYSKMKIIFVYIFSFQAMSNDEMKKQFWRLNKKKKRMGFEDNYLNYTYLKRPTF